MFVIFDSEGYNSHLLHIPGLCLYRHSLVQPKQSLVGQDRLLSHRLRRNNQFSQIIYNNFLKG